MPFSEEEFKSSIIKCNNSLTPGLDKLSQRYFKVIVNDSSCYDRCLLETTWTQAKGMTTMIGCTVVVSVSASCSRCYNLTQSSFSPQCFLMYCTSWTLHGSYDQQYIQHRYIPISLCFTNSTIPLSFLKSLPKCNLSSSLRS